MTHDAHRSGRWLRWLYRGGRPNRLARVMNWVRNLHAVQGRAVLRHGRRERVRLDEVEPGLRAPILRRYLACAPGARPHIPVDRRAPLEEFERIASRIPVFRITARADKERCVVPKAPDPGPSARDDRQGA
jgi:hypothetical protein